jgi:hypothetical protein
VDITKENYDKLKSTKITRAAIAKHFEIPEWKLKKIIAKEGWGVTRPTIKHLTAFAEESEEAYYWAGFIAADGNISDENDLYVCLNYDDTVMLEYILKYLQSNHKISSNTDKYYRSQIGLRLNNNMVEILKNKFNVTPRKSLTYELPSLPDEMFRHFLRGYFDGDGCICESFSNTNSTTATLYTSIIGSKSFIIALRDKLREELGIWGTMQERDNVNNIRYNTNASKKLMSYMYENSIVSLPRKYALYDKIIVQSSRKTR